MKTESPVREKLVVAAADLLSRGGSQALSVRALAKHAGAPLGSAYHYFPGGRQQMLAEALDFADKHVRMQLRSALTGGVADSWGYMVALWRQLLISENFTLGCPVAAVIAGNEDSVHVIQAGRIMAGWVKIWADALAGAGVARADALMVADLAISALQGAVLQCRARGDTVALDKADRLVGCLFVQVLAGR